MSLKRMNQGERTDSLGPAPIDLILVAHEALRRDFTRIDGAARVAALHGGDISDAIAQLEFFLAVLAWHAKGEDDGIFPALDPVAPDVATSYEIDHRGLDLASDGLNRAIDANDALDIARATAAFKFHLDLHLHKEEVHLYRLFLDRLSESEQAEAVRVFTDALPGEKFGEFVGWLLPLVDSPDRARVVRVWQSAMPEPVFAGTMGLVQRILGDEYQDLASRVSSLSQMAINTEEEAAALAPTQDELILFGRHVKPLFRDRDRRSMSFAFDLWSFEDVRAHAEAILARLEAGTMPCDGAWPPERVDVFRRWVASGAHR